MQFVCQSLPYGHQGPPERRKTIALHGDHGVVGSWSKTADVPWSGRSLSEQIVARHEQIVFSYLATARTSVNENIIYQLLESK
jgi:hypothetical protein